MSFGKKAGCVGVLAKHTLCARERAFVDWMSPAGLSAVVLSDNKESPSCVKCASDWSLSHAC